LIKLAYQLTRAVVCQLPTGKYSCSRSPWPCNSFCAYRT